MPASTSPEPAARTMAFTTRARACGRRHPGGHVTQRWKGEQARQPGQRSEHEKDRPPAEPLGHEPGDPRSDQPGTTQAVDVSASMRGLARSA